MAKFGDYFKPLGMGNAALPGLDKKISGFFGGTPQRSEQRSTLGPEQQQLYQQLLAAGQGPGAGGAFGASADYYRDLLSNDSQTMAQLSAPELRKFNEQIIPGLSEQFAGMGSGALSSSGFRNAAVNAGTDLSERLGAIRANLRQQGAAGLAGIGQQGLGQYNENINYNPQGGFADYIGPAIGAGLSAAGGALGGPAGAIAGGALGNFANNAISSKGQTGPYDNQNRMRLPPNVNFKNFPGAQQWSKY
jgi:hypothetical protein